MRSLLVAATLALALIAAGCGGDDDPEAPQTTEQATTTSLFAAPVVDEPSETTSPTTTPTLPPTTSPPTTAPPVTAESDEDEDADEDDGPPRPPANPRCAASDNAGEVLVEFDALDTSKVSSVYVYAETAGKRPLRLIGKFSMGEVNTSRSGGTRWAVTARGLEAGVPYDIAATSFNLDGDESGWYIFQGQYNGPGMPCDTNLPPPTGTAGFGSDEGSEDEGDEGSEDEGDEGSDEGDEGSDEGSDEGDEGSDEGDDGDEGSDDEAQAQ